MILRSFLRIPNTLRVLILVVGFEYAPSVAVAQNSVSLSIFSHPLSRTGLGKLLGASNFVDSVFVREGKDIDRKFLVFAPVEVMGFRAIARARMAENSIDRVEFVLPYRIHLNVKPTEPYDDQGFVRATIDDFTKLRSNFTKQFGEPSIMSETFFEYLAAPGVPAIRGQFRDHTIVVLVAAGGIL